MKDMIIFCLPFRWHDIQAVIFKLNCRVYLTYIRSGAADKRNAEEMPLERMQERIYTIEN